MTWNRRISMLLIPAALAFTLFGATDAAAQRGRGADRPAGPGLPTVEQMAEAVEATAEQRAALAEARLAWQEALGERVREGRRGRQGLPDADEIRTPPAMQFLVDVAPAMDTADMIALVDLLAEHRPERPMREGRGPGMRGGGPGNGPRHHQGRGMHDGSGPRADMRGPGRAGGPDGADMLVHELDLTEEQRAEVDALYAGTRGSLQALRRQAEPGEEPSEALRSEADRIRQSHQERLAEILTDEQNDELVRLRAERRAERGTEHAERARTRFDQRLTELTAILDLNDAQRKAVESVLRDAEDEATQRRAERMEVGGPMPGLFEERGANRELRTETRDAIAAELKPQQRELFAKLQSLALQGGGPQGGGHGHGPGNCDHGGPKRGMRHG